MRAGHEKFDGNSGQLRFVGEEFRHGVELTLAGDVAQDLDGALGVGTVLAGDDLDLLEGEGVGEVYGGGGVVDRQNALKIARWDAEQHSAFGRVAQHRCSRREMQRAGERTSAERV